MILDEIKRTVLNSWDDIKLWAADDCKLLCDESSSLAEYEENVTLQGPYPPTHHVCNPRSSPNSSSYRWLKRWEKGVERRDRDCETNRWGNFVISGGN